MISLETRHLLTGEELKPHELHQLLNSALVLKHLRKSSSGFLQSEPLNETIRLNLERIQRIQGKHLALLFDKPSLRTRFSFTVAMHELGGFVIESQSSTRKEEDPEDLARVLGGYCDAIVIRTHPDDFIQRMAKTSKIPVINGLSELHHPCQIFADLLTLKEVFGELQGLTLSYVGDGNNILHSFLLIAPSLGINIRYACPQNYQPKAPILKKADEIITLEEIKGQKNVGKIIRCITPEEAVENAQAVYTDTWTSMGFEEEKTERDKAFANYQVNEELMKKASKEAIVLHCLPMLRGLEISTTLPDQKNSVIFQQSENRLHVQKALLLGLLSH